MPKISNYILTQIWNQNWKYFLILGIVFLILRIYILTQIRDQNHKYFAYYSCRSKYSEYTQNM